MPRCVTLVARLYADADLCGCVGLFVARYTEIANDVTFLQFTPTVAIENHQWYYVTIQATNVRQPTPTHCSAFKGMESRHTRSPPSSHRRLA